MCYRTNIKTKNINMLKCLYVYQVSLIACFVFEKYKRYKQRTIEESKGSRLSKKMRRCKMNCE